MTRREYHTQSLAPTWAREDLGYLAGLREYLTNMMELQGYRVVVKPHTRDVTASVGARVPVGFCLLETICVVEEFDAEVPMTPVTP